MAGAAITFVIGCVSLYNFRRNVLAGHIQSDSMLAQKPEKTELRTVFVIIVLIG